ncbi:hypothetical protein EEJ42_38585, partial [Streptomyces botrytidirepellens]
DAEQSGPAPEAPAQDAAGSGREPGADDGRSGAAESDAPEQPDDAKPGTDKPRAAKPGTGEPGDDETTHPDGPPGGTA